MLTGMSTESIYTTSAEIYKILMSYWQTRPGPTRSHQKDLTSFTFWFSKDYKGLGSVNFFDNLDTLLTIQYDEVQNQFLYVLSLKLVVY